MFWANTFSAVIPIKVALRDISERRVSSQNHQSETDFIYLDKITWGKLGTKWNKTFCLQIKFIKLIIM